MKPFFSIGVTTYNRKGMLKECLGSILNQTFTDFEIIVGNDYPHERISAEILGIKDARFHFVNHPENIGEVNNMNLLLAMSRGRYFTWLADDDMHASNFLESIYNSLTRFNFQACVFTSYTMDGKFKDRTGFSGQEAVILSGNEFLKNYLTSAIKTLGCYGVFDRDFIVNIGGIKRLGQGFGPYSDVMLAIKAGLLENIIYINSPLILFRMHDQSISLVSSDVDAYSSAQEELCIKSIGIFRSETLRDKFDSNLFMLLKWCLRDYCAVMQRSGLLQWKKLMSYVLFMIRYIKMLNASKWSMIITLLKHIFRLVFTMMKAKLVKIKSHIKVFLTHRKI